MTKPNIPEERMIPIADSGNQGGIGMWPSEDWASKIYDKANWFLIGALVVGAASTVLVVWMGNVKEWYLRNQLAATQLKTEQLRKENLELQRSLLPRRINVVGNSIDPLRPFKGISVLITSLDEREVNEAVGQLKYVLREAKWDITIDGSPPPNLPMGVVVQPYWPVTHPASPEEDRRQDEMKEKARKAADALVSLLVANEWVAMYMPPLGDTPGGALLHITVGALPSPADAARFHKLLETEQQDKQQIQQKMNRPQ